MEHPRSMGPINTHFLTSARFYAAPQTYHPNFLWIYIFNSYPILGNACRFLHWNYDRQRNRKTIAKYFTSMPQKWKMCLNFFQIDTDSSC